MNALIRNYFIIFVLMVLSFMPLIDLFQSGLPITHDGQDHVARIANFYQNLLEGNIIPRWAGNLNWGYGHPILMFLYPLPSYITSLFHFLGLTLVDSIKIVFGFGFVVSGLAMYAWLKEFLGTKSAFVGAVLYMFAPYRFVDLYVRGAIGEHVAFVFLPLILYFLLRISKANRRENYWLIIGGSLSVAGLILSHNAISLMFMPLIFLYAIYLQFTSEEPFGHLRGGTKSLLGGVLSKLSIILLGLGLSAFFWLPAFMEGKYTLRDIVASGGYVSSFISNFKDFVYGQWNYGGTGIFSVQIGFVHWLLVIIAIPMTYILFKKRSTLWAFSLGLLIVFFFSLIIMMPLSKFIWENITMLQKFQFPWRFLSVTVFASSVIGALVAHSLFERVKTLSVFVLVLTVLFFNKDYWHANGFLDKQETFYTGIYNSTTDTGESAPIWSVRFMEKRPKGHMEVISGEAVIKEISRKSTVHVYKIDAIKTSRILENTLYFPGWNVFVDREKVDIEFQDPANRGLMTFYLEKGEHNVEVKFAETKLRLFADMISIASLVVIISYLVFKREKNYNPRDEKGK